MKPLQDLHPVLLEALGAHSVLRAMKFTTDEIFFASGLADNAIGVALETQGQQLLIVCGQLPAGVDPTAAWAEACETWLQTSQEDARKVYESCLARRNVVMLMAQLKARNVELPALRKSLN